MENEDQQVSPIWQWVFSIFVVVALPLLFMLLSPEWFALIFAIAAAVVVFGDSNRRRGLPFFSINLKERVPVSDFFSLTTFGAILAAGSAVMAAIALVDNF